MNVAVVCEDRFRDYIVDVFHKYPDSGMELAYFGSWDTDGSRGRSYSGIPVIPLSLLNRKHEYQYDSVLLAGFNTGYLSYIMRAVHKAGLENVSAIKWFSIITSADFMDAHGYCEEHVLSMPEGGKPCLGELQVHVTDNCNLNCKACSHFTPFVKKHRPIDIKSFESDLQELARLFSNIFILHLMGGEPLLEPGLCLDMIRLIRKYFPKCPLNIITNGTLIDRMDGRFWNDLRENDVTFRVSVYPLVAEKIENIKKVLTDNGIAYFCEIYNKTEFDKYIALTYESDPIFNSSRCHGRGCYSLAGGKLAKCPDSLYINDAAERLSLYGISGDWLYAKDAVSLKEENDGWGIIRKLEKPCSLCSRCDMSNLKKIPWMPAGHEPDLGDWFLDFDKIKNERT